MTNQFPLPTPPRRRWPWVLVVAAVVAVAAFGGITLHDRSGSCGHGIRRSGPRHECIGVSDGSFAFQDALKPVMRQIRDENRRVEKSGKKWVSIAYVEPITGEDAKEETKYGIREELEGAYLAQLQLNNPQLGGRGDLPQIRLLVANIGLRSEQWKPLTDRLVAMTHDRDHLVAVAGFGQSRDGTLKSVAALRAAYVPMMGATVTADSLTSGQDAGFFRTAPSNAAQASAAVEYLVEQQRRTPGYRVMIVRDRNTKDIYNTSLYSDFIRAARQRGLRLTDSDAEYISGIDGIANAFSGVADKVCDKRPNAVYFAGRGVNLRGFITAMSPAERRCKVTVLTGDDAVGVYYNSAADLADRKQFASDWGVSQVTVLYTALGHPLLPANLYKPAVNPYPGFRDLYHREFGGSGDEEFKDGQAILAHDAVWTIGVTIRTIAGDRGTGLVTAESVLSGIVSGKQVKGVSGTIELGPDGNPKNKPMALVELHADGQYEFKAVLWP